MGREKVIDRLQKVSRYFKSMLKVGYDGDSDIYKEHRESVKMAIELLKEQEALVRCKDCKHYEPEDKVCCHPFGAVVGNIPENFYCGYGERKES